MLKAKKESVENYIVRLLTLERALLSQFFFAASFNLNLGARE